MYTTLKFIHVMAAIVWLGASFALVRVLSGMVRAQDYAGTVSLSRQTDVLGKRIFGPAAGVTLIAGVAMVVVGGLSWTTPWILMGLGGVVLSFVFGGFLGERSSSALRAALPADSTATAAADHATIEQLRRRLVLFAAADLTVLTVTVWAMIFKPG